MEHPPKQGLKHTFSVLRRKFFDSFNGTSTKTRIETHFSHGELREQIAVLMEHPPKQGLKPCWGRYYIRQQY